MLRGVLPKGTVWKQGNRKETWPQRSLVNTSLARSSQLTSSVVKFSWEHVPLIRCVKKGNSPLWYSSPKLITSVAKWCPMLCDPMNCSTPGFPVLHYHPEFAQIHVHWVGDAIQPSHPLSPQFPSCPQSFPASGSFPMRQLVTSGGQSSFSFSISPSMNTKGWVPLDWLIWSLCCPRDLPTVLCSTMFQKHQFFGTQLS